MAKIILATALPELVTKSIARPSGRYKTKTTIASSKVNAPKRAASASKPRTPAQCRTGGATTSAWGVLCCRAAAGLGAAAAARRKKAAIIWLHAHSPTTISSAIQKLLISIAGLCHGAGATDRSLTPRPNGAITTSLISIRRGDCIVATALGIDNQLPVIR